MPLLYSGQVRGEDGQVNDPFVKFPSTPHLTVLAGYTVRDDKVLSESERNDFLRHEIIVEEKVDGANLGVSFDRDGNCRLQNRGAYLLEPYTWQWKGLLSWIEQHRDVLFDALTDRYILFGEWCRVVHSVFYDHLPDWFLGFDVYDRSTGRFLIPQERDQLIAEVRLERVPRLKLGVFSVSDLEAMIGTSRIGYQDAEGLYLRSANDNALIQRAKLVRPTFAQAIHEHWLRQRIRYNHLAA